MLFHHHVLSLFAVLVALYEETDKPNDALEYPFSFSGNKQVLLMRDPPPNLKTKGDAVYLYEKKWQEHIQFFS